MTAPDPDGLDDVMLGLEARRAMHDLIDNAEQHRHDWSRDRLAAHLVRTMRAGDRDRLMTLLLADEIASTRRARVRAIEREAESRAEEEARRAEREARTAERDAENEDRRAQRWERWRRDPASAPRNTRIFREWSQTEAGQHFLAREAEGNRRREIEDAEKAEIGIGEWHHRRMLKIFQDHADEVRAQVRLELTAELLGSEFALGDGRMVTWGRATVAEHEQRVELLRRNVSGNVAAIRRHLTAVSMIDDHGAASLSEVPADRADDAAA